MGRGSGFAVHPEACGHSLGAMFVSPRVCHEFKDAIEVAGKQSPD